MKLGRFIFDLGIAVFYRLIFRRIGFISAGIFDDALFGRPA